MQFMPLSPPLLAARSWSSCAAVALHPKWSKSKMNFLIIVWEEEKKEGQVVTMAAMMLHCECACFYNFGRRETLWKNLLYHIVPLLGNVMTTMGTLFSCSPLRNRFMPSVDIWRGKWVWQQMFERILGECGCTHADVILWIFYVGLLDLTAGTMKQSLGSGCHSATLVFTITHESFLKRLKKISLEDFLSS